MKLILCVLVTLLLVPAYSHSADLEGTWEGKKFNLSLSSSFNDIEGYWGNIEFDLKISKPFQSIEGKIDNLDVDIDVSRNFRDVDGFLPCGEVDYKYSLDFKYVKGLGCGQNFEIKLQNRDEVTLAAQAVLLDQILSYFPLPTHGAIRRFILSRIQF